MPRNYFFNYFRKKNHDMSKKHSILWGTANSIFVPKAMKKEVLRPLLTTDLDFTAQSFTAADEHPVIFMFNTQKIRIIFPFFTMNYYEMIPLIPYVHFKTAPETSYQMSPILYVSSLLIVIGARIAWHLNKVWAKFNLSAPVKDFPKVKYLNEQVSYKFIEAITLEANAEGASGKPEDFPNYMNLFQLLATNALINTPDPNPEYWLAYYKMTTREIQGATATVDVKDVNGLPKMKFSTASIANDPMGSFRVYFEWDLGWPRKYTPPPIPTT